MQIDVKYATKYSNVFASYDIKQVDAYLNESTIITYKGISKTYGELRENVVNAFKEKNFSMTPGSSYGHGNNKFVNGVQEVGILVYVDYSKNENNDESVTMQLEKRGLNKFTVK